MNGKKDTKVVFLDWYNTLCLSKFWHHLSDPTHPSHELFVKAEEAMFGGFKPNIIHWMKGKMTSEEAVSLIAKEAKIPFSVMFNEFVIGCRTMHIEPDVLQAVSNLRRGGMKVGIATDNMDSFMRFTAKSLRLLPRFDYILCSSRLRALKKDFAGRTSLFFGGFLYTHRLRPSEVMLIDDTADTDGRLSEFGIDYVQINAGKLYPELVKLQ